MPASIKHLTDKKVRYNSLLARWTDGLYYAAALTKCDKTNKRCRICFEDGSEVWVSNRDLHIQLTLDQSSDDEDIVCCICDDGNSEPPNEIILCDVCQQGYHQRCHIPPVDSSKLDESDDTKDHKDWFCATCSYILNQTNRAKLSAAANQQQQPQQPKQQPQQARQQQQTAQAKPSKVVTPPSSKPKQMPIVTQSPTTSALKSTTPGPTVPKQAPKAKQTPVSQQPQKQPQPIPPPTPQQQQQHHHQQTQQQKSQPPIHPQPRPQQQPQPRSQPQIQPQTHSQPQSQQQTTKSTIGAIKPSASSQQRSAPYYPLSSQARPVAASSSTAALASMTASSALVVGSSAGRSKQDIVKQSNRSTQRQSQNNEINIVEPNVSPPKHAVRKSSVNYLASPVRQSALPTATRSLPSPTMASNGQINKDLIATTLSSTIIAPSKSSSVSVLTSPIKQSPDKSVKQGDRSERVGSTSNIIIDNRGAAKESTNNGSTQPSISTNVSSSGVVTSNIKVIYEPKSSKETKQTNESDVHSTSEYRHISASIVPQPGIVKTLPATGQQSVINVPRADLSAKNESDSTPVSKPASIIVIASPSK